MIFFTCVPLSVVLIYSGGVGTEKETMSDCVARRHQLPLMERTDLNIMCKTVRNRSDISIEEWMVSIKLANSVFLRIHSITSYTLDFNRLYYILLNYINMKLKYLENLTDVERERPPQHIIWDWSKFSSDCGLLNIKHSSGGRSLSFTLHWLFWHFSEKWEQLSANLLFENK